MSQSGYLGIEGRLGNFSSRHKFAQALFVGAHDIVRFPPLLTDNLEQRCIGLRLLFDLLRLAAEPALVNFETFGTQRLEAAWATYKLQSRTG